MAQELDEAGFRQAVADARAHRAPDQAMGGKAMGDKATAR